MPNPEPIATESYRPSNVTEGEIFMHMFCSKCQRDAAYQTDPDNADGCPILANAFAYNLEDPEYPREWIRDVGSDVSLIGGNGARCTAFTPIGEEIPYRCPQTPDMFE